MFILIINIVLVFTTLLLSIRTVFYQIKKKKITKRLLVANLILLLLSIIINPFTLISEYISQRELSSTNKQIILELDSTKADFDKQFYKVRTLVIYLDIAVYPKKIPSLDDFVFVGERKIFLVDSSKTIYPLLQNIYFRVPDFKQKWFTSPGKFEVTNSTGLLGKPINILKTIKILKIPIEEFAVGKIKDTVGVSIAINVNGISFYDLSTIKKGAYIKKHIKNSKDTLYFDVSNIFNNPKKKIKSSKL